MTEITYGHLRAAWEYLCMPPMRIDVPLAEWLGREPTEAELEAIRRFNFSMAMEEVVNGG